MRSLLPCLRAECHRVPGPGPCPRAAAVLAHLLAARRAHAGLLRGAAAAVQLLEAHLASGMEWGIFRPHHTASDTILS